MVFYHRIWMEKKEQEAAALRGEQKEIGWGSQIRSYVFHPYSMLKAGRCGSAFHFP